MPANPTPALRTLVTKWRAEADHYQERAENGRMADLARGELIGLAAARRRDADELERALAEQPSEKASDHPTTPCQHPSRTVRCDACRAITAFQSGLLSQPSEPTGLRAYVQHKVRCLARIPPNLCSEHGGNADQEICAKHHPHLRECTCGLDQLLTASAPRDEDGLRQKEIAAIADGMRIAASEYPIVALRDVLKAMARRLDALLIPSSSATEDARQP
jgi:hypothetical protein